MASSSSKSDHHDQQQSQEESAKKMQNHDHQASKSMHTRYIAFVVLGIVVVMSAAMGTIWAVVKPKRPVYAIEYGNINDGAVITPDFKHLVGNLSFVMRSYNPNNKATIYYESMRIWNSYSGNKSVVWSEKTFSQPPFNVTRMPFVVPVQISTTNADQDLTEDLYHGKITVNISVTAKMRFGYGNWKSQLHAIGIYCQPAAVMLDYNFQTTDCYVDF